MEITIIKKVYATEEIPDNLSEEELKAHIDWYKIEDEPNHFDWISENSVEGYR